MLRLEIGTADREIWLWPVAIRAPMAHSRIPGGVYIEDDKTSYQMNPGVSYTLGGGFHCTTFDCVAQIFREGLRPGGGRRPHQHVLRAFRALGRAEPNGAAIQKD